MAARLLAQLILQGSTVLATAAREAAKAAASSSGPNAASRSLALAGRGAPMSLAEARSILGVEADLTREEMNVAFNRLYRLNDPEKGGSVFLRWKLVEAKQVQVVASSVILCRLIRTARFSTHALL